MTRLSSQAPRRSPMHFVAALALTAVAGLSVTACDGDEEPECAKDSDCQKITCSDGNTLQTCDDGVCLVGTDCAQDSDGGW